MPHWTYTKVESNIHFHFPNSSHTNISLNHFIGATSQRRSQGMDSYSALRLETLALHVLLRAGGHLATDPVNPSAQMELAAWNQLKGTFSLVAVEWKVETTEGVEATDDQWEFGLTSLRSEVPETQKEFIIQLESCCSTNCVQNQLLNVKVNGAGFLDISLAGDYAYIDDYYDLPSPSLVLSQEAFEVGRLRVSNFVRGVRPMKNGHKELVVSEERNTFTGCKEGLVWQSKVVIISFKLLLV